MNVKFSTFATDYDKAEDVEAAKQRTSLTDVAQDVTVRVYVLLCPCDLSGALKATWNDSSSCRYHHIANWLTMRVHLDLSGWF
jgi:hypothetical protein